TDEIRYLCRAVERWFAAAPSPADLAWSYAGVRPLFDDGARRAAAVSREYVLELDTKGPPALSVFGGKLTTFRRLAERVMDRPAPFSPSAGPAWTTDAMLPGGDDPPSDAALLRDHPELDAATAVRLARSYGSDARQILASPPGRAFGHGLREAELRWLVERE